MQEFIDFARTQYFVRRAEDGSYDFFTTRTGISRATLQIMRKAFEEVNPTVADEMSTANYRAAIDTAIALEEEADMEAMAERRQRFCESEEEYILKVLRENGIDSNNRLNAFYKQMESGNPKGYELDKIEDLLKGRLPSYNREVEKPFPKFGKDDVISVFRSMVNNGSDAFENHLRKSLEYNSADASFADIWIEQVLKTLCCTTDMEVAKMAFKHMMWQVKRRMYSKKTKNDLWVAFFGAQGKGKSFVMKNLIFKPMAEFLTNTKLSHIDDMDREIKKFTSNFIVNFEELALGDSSADNRQGKLNAKSLANLKALLTEDEIQVRKYHSQDQMLVQKTFVPVSTANVHLYDIIYDPTGMRRYFEIELGTPSGTTFDQQKVKSLSEQALRAWRGINEDCDIPIWDWNTKTGKKLSEIQANYRPKTNVDEFIAETQIVESETGEMSVRVCYEMYKNFCISSGYHCKNYTNFKTEILERFPSIMKKNSLYLKVEKYNEVTPEIEEML